MDFKKFLSKVLAAILGIMIVGMLVNFVEVVLLTIYFAIFKPESVSIIIWILYLLIGLFAIVFGIYRGLRAYREKDVYYEIFKPNKNKLLISLILSVALVLLFLILSKGQAFVSVYTFKPISHPLGIPLTIISYFVYFYPFSAICYFIYKFKKNKLFKNSKVIIVIMLIILNPIFVLITASLGAVYNQVISNYMNEPCGVRIVGFNEPSPAQQAGMQVNDVIIKIDDTDIISIEDLIEFMDSIDLEKELNIKTMDNQYKIMVVFDEKENKYMLGVNLQQELCKKSLKK